MPPQGVRTGLTRPDDDCRSAVDTALCLSMKAWIVVAVFAVTMALGGWMAWRWWRGRPRPGMAVAAHVVVAAMGLEVFALLLRGAPDGTRLAPDGPAKLAGLVLTAALLAGLALPIFARPQPALMGRLLTLHAGVALAGFALLVRAVALA